MIDACCWCGTDYCDVSGEIPWSVRTLDLHEHAKTGGARILPSAAYAGGYPDMWTFLCAKYLRENYGEETRRCIVYGTGGGSVAGASGGTLATRAAMSASSDAVRKAMADPFALGGFIPEYDRNGYKACTIKNGTGQWTPKMRKEDGDAALAKMTQCPYTGIWRAPNPYAFFDSRVVRRSNMLFADLCNQPYGRAFNFQLFGMMPPDIQMAAQPKEVPKPQVKDAPKEAAPEQGEKKAAPQQGAMTVADEAELLKQQGKYYAQGEGPALEDLGDAWSGQVTWAQSTSGHEVRCSFIGGDGYFETARMAIESAMTCRFDRDNLPLKGGVLTTTVNGQTWLAERLINSGIKFQMGGWFAPEDCRAPEGCMGS